MIWAVRDLTWAGLGDRLATFTTIFLGIFIEATPFLVLGTVASGLVEQFLPQQTLQRLLPRGRLRGALAGAGLGLLFPAGECGTVPLTAIGAVGLIWPAPRISIPFQSGLTPLPPGIIIFLNENIFQ